MIGLLAVETGDGEGELRMGETRIQEGRYGGEVVGGKH